MSELKFKRNWDDSCPREYDRWEQDGTTFVIQDLPPEDDDEAVKLLLKIMLTEEMLLSLSGFSNDQESVQSAREGWLEATKIRTSLACYAEKDGHRRLVAVNACAPMHKDDKKYELAGQKSNNVMGATMYAESKAKSLETLDLDSALTSYGLVVVKDYRGKSLGGKVLAASYRLFEFEPDTIYFSREPLCQVLGLKGTTTLFTSIISQKLAARAGFKTIAEIPIRELAEIGLNYPKDDERLLKVMVKRFE